MSEIKKNYVNDRGVLRIITIYSRPNKVNLWNPKRKAMLENQNNR